MLIATGLKYNLDEGDISSVLRGISYRGVGTGLEYWIFFFTPGEEGIPGAGSRTFSEVLCQSLEESLS
jgi:hypothetical protein